MTGLKYCGPLGDSLWVAGTLSPCLLETASAGLLCATLLMALLFQGHRLALAERLLRSGSSRYVLKGVTGLNGVFIAGCMFLLGVHLLHLTTAIAVLRGFPFHIVYHALLSAAWLPVLALAIHTARLKLSVDFRPFLYLVVVAYTLGFYTFFRLYYDPHHLPVPYIKASVWTVLLQLVMSIALCVLETKRQHVGKPLLRLRLGDDSGEPLLSDGEAHDVESTPAAGQKEGEEEASWISLFVSAVTWVWPESAAMQVRAILCLLLLISMRFINLAVPILYKHLVDTLSAASPRPGDSPDDRPDPGQRVSFKDLVSPWILLYLLAVFFQGGAGGGIVGFINNLRTFLWIPVSQDAYRRISLRVFDHMLINLDLSFHLKKKTGEVTKVVDRGTNAIQNILSTILFNVLPQMFDVLAAATYLAQALEPSIAIIVFITVGSYIPLTIVITEWRGKLRREMNQTDQAKSARATDALLNYETVKYFTNEEYESKQYAEAIDAYQHAEYNSISSINVLNVVQSAIMFCGIASGLLVCASGVAQQTLTVGDTVLFLSLMAQLYGPLNFFGSYYRTIQQYMIDMENLMELLGKTGAVVDKPGAKDLVVNKGQVDYQDVTFAYDVGNPVLRNVSFSVPGGQTIAFVGATGSGKSTITRLIFRFYDVNSGAIRIDGQDIRDVTQKSLRRVVGMVPQDTVLFNDTILHNIRYGNLAASDKEVEEVAQLACIHETISARFPKGYGTVVGERGLRLSGGEKQRVAFARALLKNPQILVLDEATSALDTITEKKIQSALEALRATRTTLIVAHRLSTVVDANIIVVMGQGSVVEVGSHAELIAKGGLYAEMWTKQAQGMADNGVGLLPAPAEEANGAAGASSSAAASAAGAAPGADAASGAGHSHHHHHH